MRRAKSLKVLVKSFWLILGGFDMNFLPNASTEASVLDIIVLDRLTTEAGYTTLVQVSLKNCTSVQEGSWL